MCGWVDIFCVFGWGLLGWVDGCVIVGFVWVRVLGGFWFARWV